MRTRHDRAHCISIRSAAAFSVSTLLVSFAAQTRIAVASAARAASIAAGSPIARRYAVPSLVERSVDDFKLLSVERRAAEHLAAAYILRAAVDSWQATTLATVCQVVPRKR